jgi:DNA-binding HxlR family transcriptional regulator
LAYNRTLRSEWTGGADACAVEQALASIGGKWKLRIYDIIRKEQPIRYCLINNLVADISEKTLTAQLREMEQDGIVTRIVYPEVPPRVEYQLTDLGRSLQSVFDALDSWGKAYMNDKNAAKENIDRDKKLAPPETL